MFKQSDFRYRNGMDIKSECNCFGNYSDSLFKTAFQEISLKLWFLDFQSWKMINIVKETNNNNDSSSVIFPENKLDTSI